MGSSPPPDPDLCAAVQGEPPSGKLVVKVLQHEGRLTQKAISQETRLSARTVRYALARLEDTGIVERRPARLDARQSIYSLAAEFVTESTS